MRTAQIVFCLFVAIAMSTPASAQLRNWDAEWPNTDFENRSVSLAEILSGGPPKDGIPSIDNPQFVPIDEADLTDHEPVIGLIVDGEAKAYPIRILTWHEIVNDTIADLPVAVTYCPLCNASIVFDRRIDGEAVEFGTTGNLRHSDLIMYDRKTETWWQQFSGTAIVGSLTGQELPMVPSRLESFERFRERAPEAAKVLVPTRPGMRPYGANPYVNYDGSRFPFLYRGEVPDSVPPMMRVVTVGEQGWTLGYLKQQGEVASGDLRIQWSPGQNSALDTRQISDGWDVGNVTVERITGATREDVVHHVTFAFVFYAFEAKGTLQTVDRVFTWDRDQG